MTWPGWRSLIGLVGVAETGGHVPLQGLRLLRGVLQRLVLLLHLILVVVEVVVEREASFVLQLTLDRHWHAAPGVMHGAGGGQRWRHLQ